jgi:hypothetical protein
VKVGPEVVVRAEATIVDPAKAGATGAATIEAAEDGRVAVIEGRKGHPKSISKSLLLTAFISTTRRT